MTDDIWVLKRIDARGGYVDRDGGITFYVANARHFNHEEAVAAAMTNELPCPVSALLKGFPL